MADRDLTAHRLREVLDYDPETGVFTRKVRLAQRHKAGDRADFVVTGGNLKGYRRICVDSQRYLAHRVAWMYANGEWPKKFIDHINGDKGDNRLSNLRDVQPKVNVQNTRKPRSDNKSGFLGVHWHKQNRTWRARIQKDGKSINIGCFPSPEEAHAAYLDAKRQIHKEGCSI